MRQPLQWLMGLTQLGGGSLVERRSWVGERAGNHMSRQGGFQEEGPLGKKRGMTMRAGGWAWGLGVVPTQMHVLKKICL